MCKYNRELQSLELKYFLSLAYFFLSVILILVFSYCLSHAGPINKDSYPQNLKKAENSQDVNEATTFHDVPLDHIYHDYIETLALENYIAGCKIEGAFRYYCPDEPLTRAEAAVFILRGVFGADYIPPQPEKTYFVDVSLNEWYADWVNALYLEGFTAGCSLDVKGIYFCPEREHTRAEACVFFLRLLKGKEFEPRKPSNYWLENLYPKFIFADVPLDKEGTEWESMWYTKWVYTAYIEGLIPACRIGVRNNFCPNDPITRAEAAFMMTKAKNLLPRPSSNHFWIEIDKDINLSCYYTLLLDDYLHQYSTSTAIEYFLYGGDGIGMQGSGVVKDNKGKLITIYLNNPDNREYPDDCADPKPTTIEQLIGILGNRTGGGVWWQDAQGKRVYHSGSIGWYRTDGSPVSMPHNDPRRDIKLRCAEFWEYPSGSKKELLPFTSIAAPSAFKMDERIYIPKLSSYFIEQGNEKNGILQIDDRGGSIREQDTYYTIDLYVGVGEKQFEFYSKMNALGGARGEGNYGNRGKAFILQYSYGLPQFDPTDVSIVSFSAREKDYKVLLTWETANETNNFAFEVQRSSDKKYFQKIGFVPAKKEQAKNKYIFVDEQPKSGTIFYRLRQISLEGTSQYTTLVQISCALPKSIFLNQNFPNPFNSTTQVKYGLTVQGKINIVIYNSLGQKIKSLVNTEQQPNKYIVSWNGKDDAGQNVPSGVYILSVQMDDLSSKIKMLLLR